MDWRVLSFILGLLNLCFLQIFATSGSAGNITVAGMFQIYKPEGEGCSRHVDISSVQHLEAVKWTLKTLNAKEYIPGTTIGLTIYPTCKTKDVASQRTFDLVYGMHGDRQDSKFPSNILAVIGPEFNEEARVVSAILSSLPLEERIVQIGFSITASDLGDSSSHPNLFRVVPNTLNQIQVIVSQMKKINWNYISILYEDNDRESAMTLKRMSQEKEICVPLIESLPVSSSGAVILSKLQTIVQNITLTGVGGIVFFGNENKAKILLTAIEDVAEEITETPSIIFSEGVGLKKDVFLKGNQVIGPGRGSFIITPARRTIHGFWTHWQNIFTNTVYLHEEASTNPWLLDIFENIKNCRPSANHTCDAMTIEEVDMAFPESVYSSYAIEAAFVTAKGIKLTLEGNCVEENNCQAADLIEIMRNNFVNFHQDIQTEHSFKPVTQFNENNAVSIPVYDVYNVQDSGNGLTFRKVGEWKNDVLDMDLEAIRDYDLNGEEVGWPNIRKAQCPRNKLCSECLLRSHLPYAMYYEPGDVIFVGFLPIFDRGDGPLVCGGIRKEFGLQVVQGLMFITEKANTKTQIFKDLFPNMKVGLLVVDSCNNALVAEEALITIFKRGVRLLDGTFVKVENKILGFIGEQGSSVSMAAYNVIGKMNYVQVSYASTSPLLSDRKVYPLFMRVTPPDDKQGAVIIDIALSLNFTYIQVVYSKGSYGEGGRDSILKAARDKEVCVAQVLAVEEFIDYDKILNELRKQWHAKFVAIFLRSHIVGNVMEKINEQMNGAEFTFIGSEAWGSNKNNLRQNMNLVGSLTIGIEMGQHSDFNTYFHNLHPDNYPNNPWLQSYIKNTLDCYYPDSFDKVAEHECTYDDKLASDPDFEQDIWTPFAMNALTAFLLAANKTFNELCGKIQFLCPNFHNDPNALIKNMKMIELDTQQIGQQRQLFDANGDGMMEYKIYNIQRSEIDSTKLIYKYVGYAPLGEKPRLLHNELKLVEGLISVCPNAQICSDCFPKDMPPTDNGKDDTGMPVLGAFFGITVLVLIITIVVSCILRRRMKQELIDAKTYITPRALDNLGKDISGFSTESYANERYSTAGDAL